MTFKNILDDHFIKQKLLILIELATSLNDKQNKGRYNCWINIFDETRQ